MCLHFPKDDEPDLSGIADESEHSVESVDEAELIVCEPELIVCEIIPPEPAPSPLPPDTEVVDVGVGVEALVVSSADPPPRPGEEARAGSSADPPPLPPPVAPPPPIAAFAAGPRRAIETLIAGGGRLSLYRSGNYEATCPDKRHGRCRRTKTVNGPTKVGHLPGQGRCVASLVCWLGHKCANRWEHDIFEPTWADRKNIRQHMQHGTQSERDMLETERPKVGDEDSEPEYV